MRKCWRWVGGAVLAVQVVATWAQGGGAKAADAQLARGKYLMDTVVACGNCHVARGPQGQALFDRGLSGGMVFDEPPFKAHASNITPDAETGVGKWSEAQLIRAIREGVRPDGSLIGPPMPFGFYRKLSDSDVAALVAYLRAQPPVRNEVPKSVYRMPLPASYGAPVAGVKAPSRKDLVRYGEYLADIAHCMECHTPRDPKGGLVSGRLGAGGQAFQGPWGTSVSSNLTPDASGLKAWSDDQIAQAVRTGVRPDGRALKPPMAFAFYKGISDADMAALIAYLRALPPQKP